MKASCCTDTNSHRSLSARLAVGFALLAGWAAFSPGAGAVSDPIAAPAPSEALADPWTPPALTPLIRSERVLLPVGERTAFAVGLHAAEAAYLPLDSTSCAAGILEIGCSATRPGLDFPSSGAMPGRVDFGARWQPLDGLSVGLDYFHDQNMPQAQAALLPRVLDFIAPGWYSALHRAGESEGVDLNLAYGFDAGLIGELELKVQLSHVLDLTPPRELNQSLGAGVASAGGPFTDATIGFNWSRGDFSGSLSSHYTDGVMLDGRIHPKGLTTVDINFAWRTPWNASLSVGAQNLLGEDEGMGNDLVTTPELDSAFSRVPYVRYEQDL